MKIALVQKCPSKMNYSSLFKIEDIEVFNLSSTKVSRLLKRDIDLEGFNPHDYDYVILVGSEALKQYTKQTSVTDHTGRLVAAKDDYKGFIASISPAMLAFKPENKPIFDATVQSIHKIINGETASENKKHYTFIRDTKEAKNYLQDILNSPEPVVALDSETSSLEPREGYPLGISASHKVHHGAYIDADCLDDSCINIIQEIVDKKETVFHNAKFDMKYFEYHFGTKFDHRVGHIHDTMIIHYLLDERQGTHGLKSLALKYTDLGDYEAELEEWKDRYCKEHGIKKEDFSYAFIPWDIIKVYAAKDTDATLQLFYKFYPILENATLIHTCYNTLQLPVLHFLKRLEARGVPVNLNRLTESRKYIDAIIEETKDKLWAFPEIEVIEKQRGDVFNPNSTQQLRTLLFDILKLPPTGKLTSTGAISTDKEVLEELSALHEIPGLILTLRENLKLKSTYIDKLIPIINEDSRVRTGFHQVTTTSGRLSSSGRFNMQQLPASNPIIKGCVVPPKGYKIVALD